ncbi:MAG TPA: cytochrome c, partial [Candidatus Eisenbacteria bacterium]|nr:cytochrome c [Candidatus Eisenbacteria bacterium]
QRANVATPTFHQERILQHADGFLFEIITNGLALMPSYRWAIPPADRWAIIAHVRELQQKRQASATAAPPAAAPAAADKPAGVK